MEGSADAAPQPDSVLPAGVAAFPTGPLAQYHGLLTKTHLRFCRSGQPVRHRKPKWEKKDVEVVE